MCGLFECQIGSYNYFKTGDYWGGSRTSHMNCYKFCRKCCIIIVIKNLIINPQMPLKYLN